MTFKIPPRDLRRSSRPTAERNEIQELIASFSTLGLDADLSLFTDADIVPYHLSHHHLLDSNHSPIPLSPSLPPETSFFLTPPSSPNRSPLTPISPSLDLAQLEASPSPILSLTRSRSSSLSHTPENSTPIPSPTFSLPSISRPPSPEHIASPSHINPFIAMANPSMPARGDRTAPTFDPRQPRELRRYFSDLEFHFNRSAVVDATERKKHACRFLDVDTCELWETLAEYTNPATPYEDFCQAVYRLYPGSEEERKWSVADMDKLVGESSRIGILSLSDLGEYYRQFLTITSFLLSKNRISIAEQGRAFTRGFQPELWGRILQRLQLKLPDHFPDDPYQLQDIHDAAKFILHGTSSTFQLASSDSSRATRGTPTEPTIKAEDFATMFERIAETFVKALSNQPAQASTMSLPPRARRDPNGSDRCMFCGGPDHFVRECGEVAEYIRVGKCKKNTEGRIVLSTGAFVPREIPGSNLKDRVDEWHRRNPGQIATGSMMFTVKSPPSAAVTIASRHDSPSVLDTAAMYQLTDVERIQSLERELFALRNRGGIRTRAQAQADRSTREDTPDEDFRHSTSLAPAAPRQAPARSQPAATRTTTAPTTAKPPVHPFANVPDATYAPPRDRNIGALPSILAAKKDGPAYKTTAPIYDDKVAAEVYNRAMATQVTLTQRELLSLAPEVRSQVREATSARRAPTKDPNQVRTLYQDAELPYAIDDLELPPSVVSSFANIVHQPANPPPGSLVVPDFYEQYLSSLSPGQVPQPLVVAKESSALRSIIPLVDHQQLVECVIDPGSQVIAMSDGICNELALIYDPEVVLNMQSANGEIDKSLGLARNVPFLIGDITLYLQVHIIRNPAYDVLLGRPFDILTKSIVKNFANEDQTITISDPNTGRKATIPTERRGPPRILYRDNSGFRNSRN